MVGLILGVIAVFLVFGYFGLPIIWWTLAAGALGWTLSALAGFGETTNIVLGTLFVVVAAVLNIPFLRRISFTNHAVLP